MIQQLAPALRMTILLTILTGLIYPAVVTGLCQFLFPTKANGSLIEHNGQVIGSSLLAQSFTKPEYFHPRPSAAGANGYDASASSGSNFGPTSQALLTRMKAAADQFRKENPEFQGAMPSDALTASGSGLDPHITLANAQAQAPRVAKARQLSVYDVAKAVNAATEDRDLGFLGESRVNVLQLNLALDHIPLGH